MINDFGVYANDPYIALGGLLLFVAGNIEQTAGWPCRIIGGIENRVYKNKISALKEKYTLLLLIKPGLYGFSIRF